ncbi:polysaccharide biosynthesis/export family protein [Achromobacter denitrificans]
MNTRVLRFTAIFALALLSGCSLLSGSGPTRSAILDGSTDPAGAQYDVVDLQAGTIAPYLLDKNRKDDGGTSDGYAGNIRVMPGDVLRILVADSVEGGLFAPLAAGGTLFEAVRVDANGAISLPYAGRLKVQGKSLPAIEEMVKGSLRHSAAVQPQVMVDLADDRSNSVLVAGAVPRPGRFGGIKAPLTALDAITLAGGSTLPSYQADVVIRHGREVKRIPYYQLLNGRNVAVEPRSELVVEPNLKRFVAMGALSKPGLHELPSNQTNLLDALGVAGVERPRRRRHRRIRLPPGRQDGGWLAQAHRVPPEHAQSRIDVPGQAVRTAARGRRLRQQRADVRVGKDHYAYRAGPHRGPARRHVLNPLLEI